MGNPWEIRGIYFLNKVLINPWEIHQNPWDDFHVFPTNYSIFVGNLWDICEKFI